MREYFIRQLHSRQSIIEVGKLSFIGLIAILSLFASLYVLLFREDPSFQFMYVFIPHLYLIPIILVGLWYPKSGLKLVTTLVTVIIGYYFVADYYGYSIDIIFVLLYTGLDIALFVVFLLYVKDRRLVEAVIIDLLENRDIQSSPVLSEQDKMGFDELISHLQNESVDVREEAILRLSELDDDRVILPLIHSLKDHDPDVRRLAAQSLGKKPSYKAIRPLIQILSDENRYVREAAAEALGHQGEKAEIDLTNALSDPDWHIRMGAAIALRISGLKIKDPLIRVIQDPNIYVRREVVKTLGRIGDASIIPYLKGSLRDDDSGVRLRAIRAISKIGGEVQNILEPMLNDPDPVVRLHVQQEMKKIREKK